MSSESVDQHIFWMSEKKSELYSYTHLSSANILAKIYPRIKQQRAKTTQDEICFRFLKKSVQSIIAK